jgi:hypothetical protein
VWTQQHLLPLLALAVYKPDIDQDNAKIAARRDANQYGAAAATATALRQSLSLQPPQVGIGDLPSAAHTVPRRRAGGGARNIRRRLTNVHSKLEHDGDA